MLAILDYQAGNQTSVKRALEYLQIPCLVTGNPEDLDACSGIIFPGVGSAGQAMQALQQSGLDQALEKAVAKRQPLLGICLGCQILLDASEEEATPTLGLLPGKTLRFNDGMRGPDAEELKVPHMGWNRIEKRAASRLFDGIPEDAEFYFVHSYYAQPAPDLILGQTWHGNYFCSVYGREGLWAAQFHPEKSGRYGLRFLENFNLFCQDRANAVQKNYRLP